jgi:peptidoglycan/LPS O-acetylase OafA/YrhL
MLQEESTNGRASLKNFYIRRAFRILPAALTYLLVIALLGVLHVIPFDLSSWMAAVFFYRNYWHYFFGATTSSWFTGHFWSLSVEEHFYFLLPSIVIFFPRFRRKILFCLTAISWGWLMYFLLVPSAKILPLFWDQRTEFCISALLIPAILAMSLQSTTLRKTAIRYLSPWVFCLVVLVITFYDHEGSPSYLLGIVLAKAIFNPLLLLSTVLHPHHTVTRLLETAPLKFVGRISYSLYLWQTLFLTRTFVYPGAIHLLQRSTVVGVICTFACAIASYYLIETPMIRLGRRFSDSARKKELLREQPGLSV